MTDSYKVTLNFIKMLINGSNYYPISVDNSISGEITLTINYIEAGFVKGQKNNIKVYCSLELPE